MTEGAGRDYRPPDREFFQQSVLWLAPALLGCLLVHRTTDGTVSGIITETEAYHESEPACHAHRGETPGNRPMFRRGGLAYVYIIYGIHTCFNVTSGEEGTGEAVLVRSLLPVEGVHLMVRNRGVDDPRRLCSGPGNLCRAMGITLSMNGADLTKGPLRILAGRESPGIRYSRTPRIGITRAREREWRFVAEEVEHPFREGVSAIEGQGPGKG